ncbi:hypothetical protein MTR67_042137 [Solanum verrucosum]|uniref:DRBM domain-containing protein n=1 Tax=Solanum verrucosum TaxID=315347 RepID=A0AAF0ZQV8_SOLVR|nr:hypothetical protein MTR67_042137 [Solanum verrucosum]
MVADANRLPPSPEEEITNTATSVRAMEELLKYRFRNTKLLEEALTHSSKELPAARFRRRRHSRLSYFELFKSLQELPSGTASTITSAAIRQSSMKRVEKEIGPAHDRRFICSVQIRIAEGMLFVMGDEKSRVKKAENSAALTMIRSLQESKFS